MEEGTKFCPGCGAAVGANQTAAQGNAPVQETAKKKRNKLLLVAAVVGAFFAILVIWAISINLIAEKDILPQMELSYNIGRIGSAILFTLCALLAFIFNLIALIKNNKKPALIGGILYVPGFNPISAVLCFIAYAKMKKQ
jgi:hypothetical protein